MLFLKRCCKLHVLPTSACYDWRRYSREGAPTSTSLHLAKAREPKLEGQRGAKLHTGCAKKGTEAAKGRLVNAAWFVVASPDLGLFFISVPNAYQSTPADLDDS